MRIGLSTLALGLAVLGAGAMEAHAEAPPSSKIVEAEGFDAYRVLTLEACPILLEFEPRWGESGRPIGPNMRLIKRVVAFVDSADAITAARLGKWRKRGGARLCVDVAETDAARLYADLEAMLPVGSEKGWALLQSDVAPKRRIIEDLGWDSTLPDKAREDCDILVVFSSGGPPTDWHAAIKITEFVERAEGIEKVVRKGWGMHGEFDLCLTPDSVSASRIYEEIKARIPLTGLSRTSVQTRDGRRWATGDGLKRE